MGGTSAPVRPVRFPGFANKMAVVAAPEGHSASNHKSLQVLWLRKNILLYDHLSRDITAVAVYTYIIFIILFDK